MEYRNHVFGNETVVLDGNTYDACTFRDCVLIYHGGPVQITNGFQSHGRTRLDMRDAALPGWNFAVFLFRGLGLLPADGDPLDLPQQQRPG